MLCYANPILSYPNPVLILILILTLILILILILSYPSIYLTNKLNN